MRGVGEQEVVVSGEDIVDSGPARVNQQSGSDAAAGGHTAEDEGFLDMVGIAVPCGNSRGLLRGVVQQPSHLLGVQTADAASGRRRSENSPDAMGAFV